MCAHRHLADTLHVAQISFFTDPQARAPEQLLHDWPSLVDVAECAGGAGIRTSVIQASTHSQELRRNGVTYHFHPFGRGHSTVDGLQRLHRLIGTLEFDLFHVHGLGFANDVLSLAAFAPDIPILLQDHASRPPRIWRRPLWRRGFAAVAGVAFCSQEQARPFAAAGLLQSATKVYEIPESTSRFTPGDRDHARHALGVSGDPLVLWVGHLDSNKDPLTVLEGLSRAAQTLPRFHFYCCFGVAPLLKAVQHRIAKDPRLSGRVHLLGRVPHARVEQLMRAADIFVSGSHREGSGYSLIEALSCGLTPVVTDIPSFRSLTGGGSVGALWPTGDAAALCDKLLSAAAQPRNQRSAAARDRYEKELSFGAVGRKLASAYQDVFERRRMRARPGTDAAQADAQH